MAPFTSQKVPQECFSLGYESMFYNRTQACFRRLKSFQLLDSEGASLGSGDIEFEYTAALDARSRTWSEAVLATVLDASGELTTGLTGTVNVSCETTKPGTSPCTPAVSGPDPLNMQIPAPCLLSVSSPFSTGLQVHRPKPVMTLIHPMAENVLPLDVTFGTDVRCDTGPGGGMAMNGCVYFNYTPTYELKTDNADVDEVAWHVYWAQRNLETHPGWKGHGSALTRLIDAAAQTNNRQVACGDVTPQPGKSCDKYPFASTYQGAGIGVEENYSCQMIDEDDNSLEGSTYRRPWYNDNRLLDTDPFYVEVTGPGTAQPMLGPVTCGGQ